MRLTHNYQVLTRNHNGPGNIVHKAEEDEFVHLTIHKCVVLDEDFENVGNNEITFRIHIGTSSSAIQKKINCCEECITIKNLHVCRNEEIWISCSERNQFCVYGNSSKKPINT